MKIGCNYWASNAGTHMWDDWDEAVVRRDFALMRDAGYYEVRVIRDYGGNDRIVCGIKSINQSR